MDNEFPEGINLPPVHPGEILADELAARGLAANSLAIELRIPASRLYAIVSGKRSITAETALRLGRYFGNGAQFWMNLQANFDLAVAKRDIGPIIDREVAPAAA